MSKKIAVYYRTAVLATDVITRRAFSNEVIKPGKSGKVHANVDTTGFAGPIAKAVTLETNDPSVPTAQVTISAIVKLSPVFRATFSGK